MTVFYKLGAMLGDQFIRHEHQNVFSIEQTTGPRRLCVGASKSHCDLILQLLARFQGPFHLLLVLHTPRVGDPGQYESPALDYGQVEAFIDEFGAFLENDARHDFWVSAQDGGLLVYDRHNLIYAYGPLDDFERELASKGVSNGEVAVPVPHSHSYHPEFDGEEQRLLKYFDWAITPLQPDDEQ